MSEHINATAISPRKAPVVWISAFLLIAIAIVGCGDKPPGCSDPQVVKMITDDMLGKADQRHPGASPAQKAILDRFYRDTKLTVDQITTGGYDTDAKRHSCQATMRFTTPQRQESGVVAFGYSVQSVEGKSGEFLVRTDSLPGVAASLGGEGDAFVRGVQSGEITLDQTAAPQAPIAAAQAATTAPSSDGPARADPEPVAPAPAQAPEAQTPTVDGAATAVTPSFSCAAKLTPTEKLVCDMPALAQADAKLGRLYATALSSAPDAATLKQQQRDWRKGRDACADAACVATSYERRLAELSH